jgi:hypothetical protein
MIEDIKQPYKQTPGDYIVFDEALQIKSGSALDKISTTRIVYNTKASFDQVVAEIFAGSSKSVSMGKEGEVINGHVQKVQLERDKTESDLDKHMRGWMELINTAPQQSFDVTFKTLQKETFKLSGVDLLGARKAYAVDIQYADTVRTAHCNTQEQAEYLTNVINCGGRMCRGPYQKYTKNAVSAMYKGEVWSVKLTTRTNTRR